ncbi:hypothetical protein [Sinirhodobacter huangdaonensis]|uniref:Uncharacterized protein n=1 Tax=Paenirhodobacter huangdaonensis TaxID=2501515 RepID=A0A443LSV6_9RHOB|nr:hypothetical protein [Sinirhodobacter huangdaonensis]RWR52221.1 hypothetical protein EOW66_10715 [Sinirhodobacter huangdaonensis]
MDKHEASLIIGQNAVVSPYYSDQSFVGRLHEEKIWDHSLFRQLSEAINIHAGKEVGQEIREMAFDIYSYVVGTSLLGHTDPNDCFRISNVGNDQLYELRSDVELVFHRLLGSRKH